MGGIASCLGVLDLELGAFPSSQGPLKRTMESENRLAARYLLGSRGI